MQMPLTVFVHYSLNTFYDREWGDGSEDPKLFNPTECVPDEWVKLIAESGAKLAILTCKHHGGFCLWPSKYTAYSVAASPWKNGKGDLVREFADACKKYGVKLGVYLSPWDRHDIRYGDSEAYNEYFRNQLTELLTDYGKVSVVWFDGACRPERGKLQVYDWESFYALIRKLQPECLISGIGPDIRWCGNEAGNARAAEWAVVNLDKSYLDFNHEDCRKQEIGDPGDGEHLVWYPSEVNFSIRPGWFYHKSEDKEIKSLRKLITIYFNSAGHNSVPLMSLAPDTNGKIPAPDAERLREFGYLIRNGFRYNLLENAPVPQGDFAEFKLSPEQKVNCLLLREEIRHGQRVERYAADILTNGIWHTVAEGFTIGNCELKLFPECSGDRLRVRILASRGNPELKEVGLYEFPLPAEDGYINTFDLIYRGKTELSASSEAENLPVDLLYKDEDEEFSTDLADKLPQSVSLCFASPVNFSGAILLPAQKMTEKGLPADCIFEASKDGVNWQNAGQYELSNALNSPGYQRFIFEQKFTNVKFLRLTVLSTYSNETYFRLKRFFVIGKLVN